MPSWGRGGSVPPLAFPLLGPLAQTEVPTGRSSPPGRGVKPLALRVAGAVPDGLAPSHLVRLPGKLCIKISVGP